jgi:predicted GIY-YIG superfamily endonuclease
MNIQQKLEEAKSKYAPQTINPLSLPSISLQKRSQLPNCKAIYFAIDVNDKIQYIGQTVNLNHRWKDHHRVKLLESIGEIRLAWLELSDKSLLIEIESALIAWFTPPLNRLITVRHLKGTPRKAKNRSKAYLFNLSWYHITPANNAYLDTLSEALGDSRQTLITQYVQEWLGRNRAYYTGLARLDFTKREIDVDEWIDIVIAQGFEGLPDYKSPPTSEDILYCREECKNRSSITYI